MAGGFDSLDFNLSCQVCLEEFTELGEHIPRLFPCSHTLCEKCIGQLINGSWIKCPECRKRHTVEKDGVKTFPQNKYMINNIRTDVKKKEKTESEKIRQKDLCKEHGKEIVLFCNDCETFLCAKCVRMHRSHDIIDTEEMEEIAARANAQAESINQCIQKTKLANFRNKHSLKKLVSLKEDLSSQIQKVNSWIKSIKEVLEDVPEKLETLENSLTVIQNVKDNLNNKEGLAQEELIRMKKTIDSITESSSDIITDPKHNTVFVLPEIDKAIWPDLALEEIPAAELQHHIEEQLGNTTINSIIALCSTVEDRFVVLQKNEIGNYVLLEYCLSDGEIKKEVELDGDASNMAKVTLLDTPCLVVAYPYQARFEFRSIFNLEDVMQDFIMEGDPRPWGMCAVGPSSLAICAYSYGIFRKIVTFINCSTNPPTCGGEPLSALCPVYTMCGVTLAKRELLFITRFESDVSQIIALERGKKYKLWVVEEVLISGKKQNFHAHLMTADDSGHIYVTDERNGCIYMFLVDGQFVGPVMTKGGGKILHLRNPTLICWSSHLRSLIVAHKHESSDLVVFKIVKPKTASTT